VDDPDLQLLRTFRADEAEPPEGLQARIEERLWQAILAEESARAPRRRPARQPWFQRMLRPLVAAGAAATLAIGVAVASDGGSGTGSLGQASDRQASPGVLDSTASALFGGDTAAQSSPIVGRLNLSEGDERLLDGPQRDASGASLDDGHAALARELSRDPAELLQAVRSSIAASGVDDPHDVVAFHVAMRWVADPAVPVDLRAAMLRSIQDIDGIDAALGGQDVLGRDGIVIGQLDSSTGIRSQYVLDPSDGSLFEVRSFMTSYLDPACPPGTVTMHGVYDDAGQRIDPAAAQWVAWPQVVEACAPTVLVSS
jgi:hypothetical protein